MHTFAFTWTDDVNDLNVKVQKSQMGKRKGNWIEGWYDLHEESP